METCVCMAESLRCSPETLPALLIGYAPIQNKKLKKKKIMPLLHFLGELFCVFSRQYSITLAFTELDTREKKSKK